MQEAIILERADYQSLIDRITKLEKAVAALQQTGTPKKMLSLQQVQKILANEKGKPCYATLKRWHISGKLIQRSSGRKIYYLADDVYNMKRN